MRYRHRVLTMIPWEGQRNLLRINRVFAHVFPRNYRQTVCAVRRMDAERLYYTGFPIDEPGNVALDDLASVILEVFVEARSQVCRLCHQRFPCTLEYFRHDAAHRVEIWSTYCRHCRTAEYGIWCDHQRVMHAVHGANSRSVSFQAGRMIPDDAYQRFLLQLGLCYYCQQPLDNATFHMDHMIAFSQGGMNQPENICFTCPTCNLSKHTKTPDEFFAYRQQKGRVA